MTDDRLGDKVLMSLLGPREHSTHAVTLCWPGRGTDLLVCVTCSDLRPGMPWAITLEGNSLKCVMTTLFLM